LQGSGEECLKQAADCREKAKTHPEQHDVWNNQSVLWTGGQRGRAM
jgi:hypothetical protein